MSQAKDYIYFQFKYKFLIHPKYKTKNQDFKANQMKYECHYTTIEILILKLMQHYTICN